MSQQEAMSKSVELLASIFLAKAKDGVFDVPAMVFKSRCKDFSFPDINSKDCIY